MVAADAAVALSVRCSPPAQPQDPVLFTGTLRSNLDPFSTHSDAAVWSALRKAYLQGCLDRLPLKLDTPVQENGDNFSLGEKSDALECLPSEHGWSAASEITC